MTDTDNPARERLSRLRAARQRVTDAREARAADLARRAELVESICRVCGAQVRQGEGIMLPESSWLDPGWQRNHRQVHGWRRQHSECPTEQADVIARLTGVSLTPREASTLSEATRKVAFFAAGHYDLLTGQFPPMTEREPWAWISADQRDELRRMALRVRDESRPSRCLDGACGMCGRAESIGWRQSSLKWQTGAPAPLCSTCAKPFDLASEPTDLDRLRQVAVTLWLGPRWHQMGVPATESGFRLFCEIATPAEAEAGCEPFEYRPEGLAAAREFLYQARPRYAPEDVRERIEAERRERDAQERQEADEAALHAAPWRDPALWQVAEVTAD